jgi:hypothetical protein
MTFPAHGFLINASLTKDLRALHLPPAQILCSVGSGYRSDVMRTIRQQPIVQEYRFPDRNGQLSQISFTQDKPSADKHDAENRKSSNEHTKHGCIYTYKDDEDSDEDIQENSDEYNDVNDDDEYDEHRDEEDDDEVARNENEEGKEEEDEEEEEEEEEDEEEEDEEEEDEEEEDEEEEDEEEEDEDEEDEGDKDKDVEDEGDDSDKDEKK